MAKINKQKQLKKSKKSIGVLDSTAGFAGALILGILVVSAGFFFLWVQPQSARLKIGGDLYLNDINKQLDEKQSQLNQISNLLRSYNEIDHESIEQVSVILPDKKNIPEILAQIEAISRASGVDLMNITINEVDETSRVRRNVPEATARELDSNIKKLDILMEVSVLDYSGFKRFIESVQSHNRVIDLENIQFSADDEMQQVNGKIYYISS